MIPYVEVSMMMMLTLR